MSAAASWLRHDIEIIERRLAQTRFVHGTYDTKTDGDLRDVRGSRGAEHLRPNAEIGGRFHDELSGSLADTPPTMRRSDVRDARLVQFCPHLFNARFQSSIGDFHCARAIRRVELPVGSPGESIFDDAGCFNPDGAILEVVRCFGYKPDPLAIVDVLLGRHVQPAAGHAHDAFLALEIP